MAVKTFSLLAVLALVGCSAFTPTEDTVNTNATTQDPEVTQAQNDDSTLASSMSFQNQFKQNFQYKNALATDVKRQENIQNSKEHSINHYVRGLMQDLVANLQYVNSTTPVAVVSFVMLDSDYNDANLLGIQIAESLIHEVHKFGIPVIDFKTTGYIRVTEQGDFAFSKDYEDFSGQMPARYIVGGTMLKHTDGYLVNARIVGVKSQAVVASAQSFIPNSVSAPILAMSRLHDTPEQNQTVGMGSVTRSQNKMPESASANSISLIQE
ncbi:MAG: FlgO family outer membrane protein [Paraglaciecola sp.]|uniref:FlgO family outer membrane protein n=1 Tax=Paraglaciecola sp. TaxID=1920173 RepID=UPI003296CAAE